MLNSTNPEMGSKRRKWVSLKLAPTFLFLVLVLSGCDLTELFRPQASPKKPDEQVNKSAEPNNALLTSGEKFKFHRWLVQEMQEQIFGRSPKNRNDIDGWANVLSQRGSIEGVYHGLVLSADYGALEKGKADLKAVRFFSQEMAALDFPNEPDSSDKMRLAREKYAKDHMAMPLFTLKRLMGEKILSESKLRQNDPDRLATWFASFVGRWAKAGVPFGMPQRDSGDEAFHFRWAKENNLGMIQWELLNRIHRVLNYYGGIPPVSASRAGK